MMFAVAPVALVLCATIAPAAGSNIRRAPGEHGADAEPGVNGTSTRDSITRLGIGGVRCIAGHYEFVAGVQVGQHGEGASLCRQGRTRLLPGDRPARERTR